MLWRHEERKRLGVDASKKHDKVDTASVSLAVEGTCMGKRIAAQKVCSFADAWNYCHGMRDGTLPTWLIDDFFDSIRPQ